jgi:hypothetical protein
MTPYPYWGSAGSYYRPYRYASIQDDFGDVITSVGSTDVYQGAAAGSRASFPASTSPTVPGLVVASSADWTDSLSAASLAAGTRGPVLLTSAHSLAASTTAEIKRLKPATVYVLGSASVVDDAVAAKIAALGPKVVRLSGADRYATASMAATTGVTLARNRGMTVDTAYLVTGADFPDAFAASPVVVKTGRPILCATATGLPKSTAAALQSLKIKNVVIVGSTTTIGANVESALLWRGLNIRRIAGADHYAVARALAAEGTTAGLSWKGAGVTSDARFADSLVGGVTQGFCNAPLLLTPATKLDKGVGADILAHRSAARPMRAFGGYTGVSWAVRNAIAYRLRQP